MAFAMIKKQNKCNVPYYVSYCCRVFGRTWGITVILMGVMIRCYPHWPTPEKCVTYNYTCLLSITLHYVYKNDPCFSAKYRVIPAQTLTPFDANIIYSFTEVIFFYICLTSEADRKELQCHANCSVFQVLICLKSKKEKSGTLVLSLVLDVHIPHFC